MNPKRLKSVTTSQDEPEEDEEPKHEALDGLGSKLLKARVILVSGQVDQELAQRVIAQALIMDAESNDPIKVIITSQGGHVDAGFAIYDMLRFIKSKIHCIGAGWVASIAVPVMLAAPKERRFALPNTRFLLHQPSGGVGGHLSDIRIEAREIIKIRERINDMIARETGQTAEKIAHDSDRNFWMNAKEALDYGIITKIVKSVTEL